MENKKGVLLVLTVFFGLSEAWSCTSPPRPPMLIPGSEYKPRGKFVEVAGISVYEVGPANPKLVLIGFHDVFGLNWTHDVKEIGDILADGGYKVSLPYFYNGKPWTSGNYSDPAFTAFLEKNSWENATRSKLRSIVDEYRTQGYNRFGLFGFSFGANNVAEASVEFWKDFQVAAQFTPGPTTSSSDVNHSIKVPTLLVDASFPSVNKTEFCHTIEHNVGRKGSCRYVQFPNAGPGFLGGNSDWTNATIRETAEQALGIFMEFLCKNG